MKKKLEIKEWNDYMTALDMHVALNKALEECYFSIHVPEGALIIRPMIIGDQTIIHQLLLKLEGEEFELLGTFVSSEAAKKFVSLLSMSDETTH